VEPEVHCALVGKLRNMSSSSDIVTLAKTRIWDWQDT